MSNLKAGDLVAFSGANLVSDFINVMSYGWPRWGISHVGILAPYGGELLLFESTTLNDVPCVIRHKPVRGAQAQYLDTRLDSYKGRIWHYPLSTTLTGKQTAQLTAFLLPMLGTPYSEIEAVRAGGLAWSWLENRIHGPKGYAAMFCSAWTASAHEYLGILKSNTTRWNPNRLIRHERRHGLLAAPGRLK